MMVKAKGFFPGSIASKSTKPPPTVPYCGACGLFKKCGTPKMKPFGKGKRRILLLGEAPGATEDEMGRPFVGKSGQHLRKLFRRFGVDMNQDCVTTNAIICHPDGNRTPTDDELEYCRPNLVKLITKYKPELIITFGGPAIQSLLKHYWKEDVGGVTRWAGYQIPFQKLNAWICPTYHPAFVLREDPQRSAAGVLFENQLQRALELSGRPWEQVPDYRGSVERLHNPNKAAKVIREMVRRGGPCAWDYETNMLKPDGADARIVSCSICWRGKRTIAYPWKGEAIQATQEFLRSPLPKIASNLKFEERWTRKEFGHRVRNWLWDTMLGGHLHDNRKAVTSIKFQALVWLGFDSWNDHIEKYLRAPSTSEANQIIREIDPDDLLLYNGLDSLLEYLVAFKQMEYFGYER